MPPFYRDTVCISCLIHKGKDRLDEVSSLRAVALGVVAHVYHELQQRLGAYQTNHRQEQSAEDGTGQGGMDDAGCGLIIACAHRLCRSNTGTNGKTHEKVDHQCGNGSGRTHRRNGNTSAEPSHHHQVGCVEENLQKTGDRNGDGEEEDVLHQRAVEHVVISCAQKNRLL